MCPLITADPRLPHLTRQIFSFLVLHALPVYDILMMLSSICALVAQWSLTPILVWLCKHQLRVQSSVVTFVFIFWPCGDVTVLISLRQHVKFSCAYGTYLSGEIILF